MLRRIRFQNVVGFKEVDLKFEEKGVYFMIGGSGTGKSCVFEAIRKCLKTSDVGRLSSKYIPDTESIVLCEFQQFTETKKREITSGYMDLCCHIKCEPTNKCKIIKFLVIQTYQGVKFYAVSRERNNENGVWKIASSRPTGFKDFLGAIRSHDLTDIIQKLKGQFDLEDEFTDDAKRPKNMLDEIVEDEIFIPMTLNHRGVNPSQSLFGGADRFLDSSRSADVLHWFIENQDRGTYDRQEQSELFNLMTNEINYTMDRGRDGELFMVDNTSRTRIPLLRLPEGILEAKIVSILLSKTRAMTVCLEEPQKGMDLQTKLRLRDTVLKQVNETKKRLVLVTTNDPCFVTDWGLENCFFFRKQETNSCTYLSLDPSRFSKPKMQKFITNQPYNLIFVSKRLFFVEGISDQMFLEEIRNNIRRNENAFTENILEKCGIDRGRMQNDALAKCLKDYLLSLVIIVMGSEGDKEKTEVVCQAIGMQGTTDRHATRFYLLDKDAKENKKNQQKGFEEIMQLEFHNMGYDDLSVRGMFIWNNGLEKDVFDFCEQHGLLDNLEDNKVPTINRKKIKGKLFMSSQEITQENKYSVVKAMLDKVETFRREDYKANDFGTFPRLLKFLVNHMLLSINHGEKLTW